ncbi:MAG: hypothetical protein LPK14_07110 [Hymenobacteraceae bacterium]|nr:hypothetical protein [Hymenobacteraceae bacterium]
MKQKRAVTALVICIAVLAALASATGIVMDEGPGRYTHESIRGSTITIYGKGLYRHMSADVAIQGIAQDYVTLFLGIPLLLLSLYFAVVKNSLRGRFLLAGVVGYFLVTYLFYTTMGMYNAMFLAYVTLLATSFFALSLLLLSFDLPRVPAYFSQDTPVRVTGGFLIFNSLAIAFLWLGIIVPPLLDGTIIPLQVEHYTTLIVQGLDLGLLLPLGFVSGLQFLRRRPWGYLLTAVYFGFLSLLMTALTAKIIAMALAGVSVFPVVFIIPTFNLIAIVCEVLLLRNIRPTKPIV